VRYEAGAVADIGAVLCPPYDVITAEDRARLAARHARNAVRLELPEAERADEPPYAAAARLFAEWQGDGTLTADRRPMVYVYEQEYRVRGSASRVARGFFCRLRLEDYGAGVRRHERTHTAPKEDRYQLLRAVRANLSPVLMLYDDGRAASRDLLGRLTEREPDVDAADEAGNRHALWAIDPSMSEPARMLVELAAACPLTIADGHHRYETALRYRDEVRDGGDGLVSGADFVLVLLYEAASGGLSVLPTHRMLRLDLPLDDLIARAEADHFAVRPIAFGELMRHVDDGLAFPGIAFAVSTRDGSAILTAPDMATGGAAAGVPEALRRLPVAVLDAAIERWAGTSIPDLVARGRIIYSKEARAATDEVAAGRADAAFLLPSTPIAAVLEVAAAGEVMPQKSTYFEPKAATGLVFNALAE
jgi:uncharacterized protein (DUF1015 family)